MRFCGECGRAQESVEPQRARSRLPVAAGVCVVLILAGAGWWFFQNRSGGFGARGLPTRQPGSLTTIEGKNQTVATELRAGTSALSAHEQGRPPELPPTRVTTENRPPVHTERDLPQAQETEPPRQPIPPPVTPPQTTIVERIQQPQETRATPVPGAEEAERALRQRVEIFRPEAGERVQTIAPAMPGKAAYTGPPAGVITWSGKLDKDELVTIESGHASMGQVQGSLPGVPVMLDINQREFALAELPAPGNGWSRLAIRSRKNRHTVITIHWTVLE